MNHVRALVLPLASLFTLAGLAACEEETSPSGAPPPGVTFDGVDGGPKADGGDPPVASKCAAPTAAATVHNKTVETDETWGAGYHDVTFDVSVRNATLTIAPCAIVRVVPSRGLQIGFSNHTAGKIVAKGQADLPIVFEAKDASTKWSGVQVNPLGSADLAYVTIKDGGLVASSRGGGALHLLGDGTKPLQRLATVDHVTIEGAPKYGAVLESHGGFTDASHDLVVKGAGDVAMRVTSVGVGTIPTGSYVENAVGAIRIWGDQVNEDVTFHDRGVPYVVGGDGMFPELSVQGADGISPLLTLEAGVVLKFAKQGSNNSGLFVERASTTSPARGALHALGTVAKPVVFTSAEATPAAGDWVGIFFRGIPDPRNKIDFARVEYAGADTGTAGFSCGTPASPNPGSNEAAIAIFGPPATAFVTNTAISHSAMNGIERAWTGTPIDFLATNTFTSVQYCRQTFPRPPTGSCPAPAPCD
jgi:hypothetical protein